MKEPTTEAELKALHRILRINPQRYLKIVEGWLSQNPDNANAYFSRHLAWMSLGEPLRALEDLNKAWALSPHPLEYISRARVHRHLGEYQKALDDFARSEAIIPEEWEYLGFGLLWQADCHARLGDEEKALACWARVSEDCWTLGFNDAPSEEKVAVAEKLKLIAAEAKRARK